MSFVMMVVWMNSGGRSRYENSWKTCALEARAVRSMRRQEHGAIRAKSFERAALGQTHALDELSLAIDDVVEQAACDLQRGGRKNPDVAVEVGLHLTGLQNGRVVVGKIAW